MTASTAQIVNDLAAWSRFYEGRDAFWSDVFHDTGWMICRLAAGEAVDGRTYHRLEARQSRALDMKPWGLAHASLERGQDEQRKLRMMKREQV